MTPLVTSWPCPNLSVDGPASVDADGENQACACGSDTHSEGWRAADQTGWLSLASAVSTARGECTVYPRCGRIYPNETLFAAGDTVTAVVRYDLSIQEWADALTAYDHEIYGAPERRQPQ